jgi:hypothetical protein
MTSAATKSNDAFGLLAAIVAGEATIEDGVSSLKAEGIESVEAMLTTLRLGFQERARRSADALRPVDLSRRREKTSPEIIARNVHRVPEVPFTLNGVMYDPKDITRFNGQELHFVAGPTGADMLAVDNRELMENWWNLTYLDRYRHTQHTVEQSSPTRDVAVRSSGTWYWEDDDRNGGVIYLSINTGFYDLTRVDYGLFGDWNDRISSFEMMGSQVCVLWDHIHWTGDSFTKILPFGTPGFIMNKLRSVGFNDRASSLETW